jgi:dienelactone hydrolase
MEYRSKELYADFYENEGKPLVALIAGSRKGIAVVSPRLLDYLKKRYNVLLFAYFGVGELPPYLENIPLEYFIDGINRMKTQLNLQDKDITLIGNSKGGEAVLLMIAKYIKAKAAIACVPSCYAWQGIPHSLFSVLFPRPSWTYNRKPVPYIKFKYNKQIIRDIKNNIFLSCSVKSIAKNKNLKAKIDLDQYKGKLLLLSAEVDNYWPSKEMCNVIERDYKIDVTHKVLNIDGHYFLEYNKSVKEIIDFLKKTK